MTQRVTHPNSATESRRASVDIGSVLIIAYWLTVCNGESGESCNSVSQVDNLLCVLLRTVIQRFALCGSSPAIIGLQRSAIELTDVVIVYKTVLTA